jgi:CheY-like chemotaxis protein
MDGRSYACDVSFMCVTTQTEVFGSSKITTSDCQTLNWEAIMRSNPLLRVLCVDDDEDSRAMLVTLFKLASVEAKAVGTAVQALSLIQAEHFDLYLLDGRLPKIDGFELCRQLRAVDSDIPILFFSGADDEADREKGIAAGADAYVAKPDIDALLEMIEQLTSPEGRLVFKQIPCAEKRPRPHLAMHAHGRG